MLAREYCDAARIKLKPIILSHHMLYEIAVCIVSRRGLSFDGWHSSINRYGLAKGQQKMSKSEKESAIFMEDTAADVARKINNAYVSRLRLT
jgi:tyrosyl-tRNA synthetase